MRKYLIVIEKSGNGYGAYSPDITGCVAVADTQEEVEQKMYEAITFHLDGMREVGLPLPSGESVAEYVFLPEAVA